MHKFYIFIESRPSYLSSTLVPVTLTASYDFSSILFIFHPCLGLLSISMALSFLPRMDWKCDDAPRAKEETVSWAFCARWTSAMNYSIFLLSKRCFNFFSEGRKFVLISYFSKYINFNIFYFGTDKIW